MAQALASEQNKCDNDRRCVNSNTQYNRKITRAHDASECSLWAKNFSFIYVRPETRTHDTYMRAQGLLTQQTRFL